MIESLSLHTHLSPDIVKGLSIVVPGLFVALTCEHVLLLVRKVVRKIVHEKDWVHSDENRQCVEKTNELKDIYLAQAPSTKSIEEAEVKDDEAWQAPDFWAQDSGLSSLDDKDE